MNTLVVQDDDNKTEQQISLTPPPLLDKHFEIDMFSNNETKDDVKNDEIIVSTPPKVNDDSIQDAQYQTPKKVEPVLGKERAIKILKAFGSKQKPVKEFHQNVLKTPNKECNKPKREKKSLTPMEKAKETISQIEELKKFKDRTIPTYFGENVVIHHIKDRRLPNETKVDNNKSENVDKVNNELAGTKITIDSLEALKVYNVDKQSDDEINSEKEDDMDAINNDVMEASMKKRKLPIAFDLKAKRAKEKRRKRNSLDSRSSEKKRKHRNKDRKKKKSRDSSSRRSSENRSKKRSKKKREATHDMEISSHKSVSLESQGREYQLERYTKTLPVIKYSANPHYIRHLLSNGITGKDSTTKKKKRSSSKSTLEKEKRKKSSDRNAEKGKVKERRRSGSTKSVKKRRRDLEKSLDKLIPKIKEEKSLDGDESVKVNATDEKSPNSEEYQSSNWDNWDNWESDDMTASSLDNLIPLDTIPLQLNVPKQDRTMLYINEYNIKAPEENNQTTPRMTLCDQAVVTPVILDFSEAKCQRTDSDDLESFQSGKSLKHSGSKLSSDNDLDKYITKISPKQPIKKNAEEQKSNHQPIAQLYDEYEQFIMSCMPGSEENNRNNGDKSSITSSLFDETLTSNDGEEELEALKMSLEKKLHEIEHPESEDATKTKEADQLMQIVEPTIVPDSTVVTANESTDSSSSSSSSSSSDSSSSSASSTSHKKKRKKKGRKENAKSKIGLGIDDDIFNLKTGIEDDELSDNELLSKVEQLKQQFSEKRKALANKRKLAGNDSESSESLMKIDLSDALLSPEKRSAISLKIGNSKPNSIMKPVMLDDDDFTEKLLLEVTPNSLPHSKETNKLLIERIIEPEVGLVSSSNSNSLASEIINTKVCRIEMLTDIFPKGRKPLPIDSAIVKIISNQSLPVSTSEMKNYLNNTTSHFDSSDSKTSGSLDSTISSDSSSAIRKVSPVRQPTPSRSDKRDSCESNSKNRPLSPYHRSRTKEVSSKRHFSPQPRHRSPRSRKRLTHRSPSPIRKRSRGSPRRSRSPRKSPRRLSPRRIRRSLSPRSKRPVSPIRGRPRTPPTLDKQSNRKWEPPHTDYKSLTKNVVACDNNVPQPICRLESTNSTSWVNQENSAFAQYDYQHIHPVSPKRSLDERIANSFNHSDQSYDFHQASGAYMNHFQYSAENTSKIPVLNSHENYYFQPHLPPQPQQPLPPQPLPPPHLPRQHAPPQHVQRMVPNQLSPQSLSTQHVPPQQRIFSNLIEIRQSNIAVEPTPFVVKGNVLEIVPKIEPLSVEPLIDTSSIKVEDESYCEIKQEKIELTEEEIQRRELKKAELKLKRKQERDKRHLERFMRKEKLKLEIKHLMEVSVYTADTKKATYNPNAIGGKSILRLNASNPNKKSVLFADGVAPGDGTSTSGGEDVAPLLRDRNKRMTKKKLDSKRRRARREATIIKKEVAPQTSEITPFIDPELENMPPPLPPDGNPPARLVQPKLKSTPKLIYFHYDPRSNAMYVSPFPTAVHIPQTPSDQTLSAMTKPSMDSPTASLTPDLIQRPKVCFIQPPTFEQQSPQTHGPVLPNHGANITNPPPLMLTNSVGSIDIPTPLLQMKLFNQQHQPPSSNSLPTSPAIYPTRQTHSLSPQNYRGPVHPINQQSIPVQPTPLLNQLSPMASQWDNSGYQTNTQIPPLPQQPGSLMWESDGYFPPSQPIRPHTRFNNANNITQQRPTHNQWDQQRHPTQLFQNQVHPPQSSFANMQSHPRSNHPRFHQNQSINPSHQQHNNFAFNSNYNYNTNSNQSWNHQYRNNH